MNYLFNKWVNLKETLKDKYLLLLLDYDGTLTLIVETPEKAIIPQAVKILLKKLSESKKCKIAIISGRALKDIKNKVGLENIIYVGNHGSEIEGPKIKFESPVSFRYKNILKQIKNDLSARLSIIKGAFVEDKGLTLSVHYRLVDKKYTPLLKTIFHETVIIYLVRNKIKIRSGKKVLEIRPPGEWNKARVVLWLLARQRFALKNKNIFPIYIGDDVTDEDAFKVLKNKGLTVFVGQPKKSHAKYYLKSPEEVTRFLRQISDLFIKEHSHARTNKS